jgi:hypothetical protein
VKVVLVTNLELGARRWFATPKKGPATAAVRELVGKDSLERAAAWPALEKAKGFRGAAEVALGGGSQGEPVALGGKQAVAPLEKAPAKDNFTERQMGVRLLIGGKAQEPVAVGTHAAGAKAPGLWVLRLPRGPRAYVATARCAGGPPPGRSARTTWGHATRSGSSSTRTWPCRRRTPVGLRPRSKRWAAPAARADGIN